jgi:hypothetical protein
MNVVLTKEFLQKEYIKKKKPINQIAKDASCGVGTIFNYLKKFKIKTRTYSELMRGSNNPNFRGMSLNHRKNISKAKKGNRNSFKGGRNYNDAGYILIHMPTHPFSNNCGYVREHRLTLEKYLGRYLKPKEVPHHLNEVKDDNRVENLLLFASQSAHVRFENNRTVKPEEIIFDGRNCNV